LKAALIVECVAVMSKPQNLKLRRFK